MYIKPTVSGYDSSGEQVARRQLFLMLVQPKVESRWENDKLVWETSNGTQVSSIHASEYPMRAIVRKVALRQFGHWMMGHARVKGHSLSISGSYGSDGLPMNVPHEVYDEAVELPKELYDAWNNGGGWNGCGSEAESMRQWALDNLDVLYKAKGG